MARGWIQDPDPEIGRFGLDTRFATADEQGRFVLRGLRKESPFMLHANCRGHGATHEGSAVDAESVELVLR